MCLGSSCRERSTAIILAFSFISLLLDTRKPMEVLTGSRPPNTGNMEQVGDVDILRAKRGDCGEAWRLYHVKTRGRDLVRRRAVDRDLVCSHHTRLRPLVRDTYGR